MKNCLETFYRTFFADPRRTRRGLVFIRKIFRADPTQEKTKLSILPLLCCATEIELGILSRKKNYWLQKVVHNRSIQGLYKRYTKMMNSLRTEGHYHLCDLR